MDRDLVSINYSNFTCLVLGGLKNLAKLDTNKSGIDLLTVWLQEKNLKVISDMYKIEIMLREKKTFDIIFISTCLSGNDDLFDSYNFCSSYIKNYNPSSYVVLVEEEPIIAREKCLQEYEIECFIKFETCFDNVLFMSEDSLEKVLSDFKKFKIKKLEV